MTVSLLRGHAHFLFDTKKKSCSVCLPVQPRLRVDRKSLYFPAADVLLMSPLMWEMSAGREDWGG